MVRQRHPPGAFSRDTHAMSPVDYAQVSDRLYGAEMDIEAVTVVDLGQGSVTDGAIAPGGLDGSTVIRAGTLPPATIDTTPPPLPSTIVVTSEMVPDSDGRNVVAIVVTMVPPVPDGWPSDYFATYIYATNESDNDPVTPTPVWTRPIVTMVGKGYNVGTVTGVAGATQYWVKVRTVDQFGNYSADSAYYPVLTVSDATAPGIPQAVSGAGGFRSIGVLWAPSSAADLMHNEVRYAPSLNPDGTGGPNTALWQVQRTRGNSIYVGNLLPASYYAQVRAVDYSRNVAPRWTCTGSAATDIITCLDHTFVNGETVVLEELVGAPELQAISDPMYVINATAGTFQVALTLGGAAVLFSTNLTSGFVGRGSGVPVNYLTDFEAGWSYVVGPLVAALVGQDDIAFNSVISNIIATGILDAATIQTGILSVNTADGAHADGIQVLYGGVPVGEWNEDYLDVRSKTEGRTYQDFIRLDGGVPGDPLNDGPRVTVYLDGQPQAAITKDGINATAINFGTSPGGHNLVFNSSFELAQFVATSVVTIGSGGSTLVGGVGGWVAVSNTNAALAAGAVTMAAL